MPSEPDAANPSVPAGGVFISHVHEDRNIAEAFSILIQDVTAGSVPTYASSATGGNHGIKYGTEWFQWIRSRINTADNVVAILTPNSVGRPWILFEAGLGKATSSGSVFGLAVGMGVAAASVGPFGVFQNSSSEKPALIKLCRELIEPSGLHPRDEVVGGMVDGFLSKIEHSDTVEDTPYVEDPKSAAIFQALEDLKYLVRERPVEPRLLRQQRDERELEPLLELLVSERQLLGTSRIRMLADLADSLSYPALGIALRQLPNPPYSRRPSLGRWLYVIERLIIAAEPHSATSDHFLFIIRRELEMLEDQRDRAEVRQAEAEAQRGIIESDKLAGEED